MVAPAPRRGGGVPRERCHLGHPIETRVYAGKKKRRCWTCNAAYQKGRPRKQRPWIDRTYGLSEDDWQRLFNEQGGLCAVCREAPATCVDHDHETGRVRGLLCRTCNLGIGHLKDDPERLESAARYLRAPIICQSSAEKEGWA